jgi:photosynthetic reaction center cytochrome c subunit
MIAGLAALGGVWLLGVVLAASQTAPQERPVMSDEFFKNVQVLKGIPVDEFLDTMGMFAASTGLNCTDCHIAESGGSWARYADDSPLKLTTRRMMAMVNNINASNFGGRRVLTCYSCHNGGRRPRAIPSLAVQYAVEPLIDDPYEILQSPGAPSAAAVLDKYIQAAGGAARLAGFTSVVARGTYRGFDDFEMYPLEIFAKAPNQRTTILHSQYGDVTTTYDGRSGWMAAPTESKPAPVMGLTGGNLEGADIDAELAFPGQIKQVLGGLVVGPLTLIGDRDVRIVQGKKASGSPVKLYFEEESGLLVRVVRYSSDSPVGRVPTQIDYEDYRDVSGIKIPFKWTSTWTDGRTVFELSSVQLNTRIDATRFAKPTPPAQAATP